MIHKRQEVKGGKASASPPICIAARVFQPARRLHLLGGQTCDWMADLGHGNESCRPHRGHGKSLMCTYLGYELERLEEVSGGWLDGGPSKWSQAGKHPGWVAMETIYTHSPRGNPAVGQRHAAVCLSSHLLPCLPGGSKTNSSHLRGQQ